MNGIVFLIRTYWAQVLGFLLTVSGAWLLVTFGPTQDVLMPSMGFVIFGYQFAVFGSEPWRFREKGAWRPVLIFVHWFGLVAFFVAALIPIAWSVAQSGWTQLNAQMAGLLAVVVVLTAARGVWEWKRNRR